MTPDPKPDPLPPLAEIFRKIAEPLEAKERSARARKYTSAQLGSDDYAPEAWEQDAALYGNDAASFRRAESLAAPYDAELARLRGLLREARPHLGDRLSQFRAGSPRDVALSDLCIRIDEVTA